MNTHRKQSGHRPLRTKTAKAQVAIATAVTTKITTAVGETFEVSLPSYLCANWKLTPSTKRVKQIGKPLLGDLPPQIDSRGDHFVGRFAPTIVAFKALKPGRCTIKAACYQIGESRAMDRKTITIIINASR